METNESDDSDQNGDQTPSETDRLASSLAPTTKRTDNFFLTSERVRLNNKKTDDNIKRYDQVELFKKVTESDMRAAAKGELANVFRN